MGAVLRQKVPMGAVFRPGFYGGRFQILWGLLSYLSKVRIFKKTNTPNTAIVHLQINMLLKVKIENRYIICQKPHFFHRTTLHAWIFIDSLLDSEISTSFFNIPI